MDAKPPLIKFEHKKLSTGVIVLDIHLHKSTHWTFHSMSQIDKSNELSVFMPDNKETQEFLDTIKSEGT